MILKYFFLLLPILFCHAANAQTDSVTIRLGTQSKSVYLTAPPVLPVYLNPIELYGDSAAVSKHSPVHFSSIGDFAEHLR
jgi:hypothetical protein